jgi:two-component system, LuxR family, response regulator FixJ
MPCANGSARAASSATKSADDGAPLVRIVDDEPTIRDLVRQISVRCGFQATTAGCVREFLAGFDDERPGCVVLDLHLPDGTGIELLESLCERHNALPVVVMSGCGCVAEAVRAFKLGSIDFLEKPFTIEQMQQALRAAVDLDAERRCHQAAHDAVAARFGSLSERECEVLDQIVHGAANKTIAATLGLSTKTVEVHRANVMRKTGAGSLAELVRLHVACGEHGPAPARAADSRALA